MLVGVIQRVRTLGRLLPIPRGRHAKSAVRPAGPEQRRFASLSIAGLGPRDERAVSLMELELTDEEAERASAARFKVGIVLHTLESD